MALREPQEVFKNLEDKREDLKNIFERYKKTRMEVVRLGLDYEHLYARKYMLVKFSIGGKAKDIPPLKTVGDYENHLKLDEELWQLKVDHDTQEEIAKLIKKEMDNCEIEIETLRSELSYLKGDL